MGPRLPRVAGRLVRLARRPAVAPPAVRFWPEGALPPLRWWPAGALQPQHLGPRPALPRPAPATSNLPNLGDPVLLVDQLILGDPVSLINPGDPVLLNAQLNLGPPGSFIDQLNPGDPVSLNDQLNLGDPVLLNAQLNLGDSVSLNDQFNQCNLGDPVSLNDQFNPGDPVLLNAQLNLNDQFNPSSATCATGFTLAARTRAKTSSTCSTSAPSPSLRPTPHVAWLGNRLAGIRLLTVEHADELLDEMQGAFPGVSGYVALSLLKHLVADMGIEVEDC